MKVLMKRNLLFINILHTMQNKLQPQASQTDIHQVSSIITIPTFAHLNWPRHNEASCWGLLQYAA